MIENLLATILLFVVAVGLCIVLNFTLIKQTLMSIPLWMERVIYVGCVGVIFFVLHQIVSAMWALV